jgi:hypothetical protein
MNPAQIRARCLTGERVIEYAGTCPARYPGQLPDGEGSRWGGVLSPGPRGLGRCSGRPAALPRVVLFLANGER